MIKLTILIFVLINILHCSESRIHDYSNGDCPLNLPNKYFIKYTLTRQIFQPRGFISEEQIISNGNFHSVDEDVYNENERSIYVKQKDQCILMAKKYGSLIRLDTSYTDLFVEPYIDFNILNKVLCRQSKNKKIGKSGIINFDLGDLKSAIDSVTTFNPFNKRVPDSIKYYSKNISSIKYPEYIVDVVKIVSISNEVELSNSKFDINSYINNDSFHRGILMDLRPSHLPQSRK